MVYRFYYMALYHTLTLHLVINHKCWTVYCTSKIIDIYFIRNDFFHTGVLLIHSPGFNFRKNCDVLYFCVYEMSTRKICNNQHLPLIYLPDILSFLIWVQTVCKGYQQTTKKSPQARKDVNDNNLIHSQLYPCEWRNEPSHVIYNNVVFWQV